MLYTATKLVSLLFYYTSGVNVPIINPSFETDFYPIPNNTYIYPENNANITAWPDWDPTGCCMGGIWCVGVENPTTGTSFYDPTFGTSSPDGNQNIYLEPESKNKGEGDGEFGIEQELTGQTVAADTTYTLSGYVGNPDDNKWSGESTDPNAATTVLHLGFPGYKMMLLTSDDTVLVQDDNTLAPALGQWVYSTSQVTINAGNANIGKTLKIRLVHKNSAQDTGYSFSFDAISLTAEPAAATTSDPTAGPTGDPTGGPTTTDPTLSPSADPSPSPSKSPSKSPTKHPTKSPSDPPTAAPSIDPTKSPSGDPTSAPSDDPTKSPTNLPSKSPSEIPTKTPTKTPTLAPTKQPTPAPSDDPTPAPSFNPTDNPTTPSPTPPGTLVCGVPSTGAYNGAILDFVVNLPHRGDIQFDASNSDFNVTAIEATAELGTWLTSDFDEDQVVTLVDRMPGNYVFKIDGGAVAGQYDVRTSCTSKNPTQTPSHDPTGAPSNSPTAAPTLDPTDAPSNAPSAAPSNSPSFSPTAKPTPLPTDTPTKSPSVDPTRAPTDPPTRQPSDNPSRSPSADPTHQPSKSPTKAPTDIPSMAPTQAPTDLPTPAGTLNCGDQLTSLYKGEPVTIIVNVPFDEMDLEFDATASQFALANIQAFIPFSNTFLGSDENGIVTLLNRLKGNYKFIMYGDGVTSTYSVEVRCTSKSPTPAPTVDPTPAPTVDPTLCPTATPTTAPTDDPTTAPTGAPTAPPTEEPPSNSVDENKVTTVYLVKIEVCEYESIENCEFDEDDITTAILQTLSEFTVTVSNVQTIDDTVMMDVSVKTDIDNILSERDMEDEIEEAIEPIHSDADITVSRNRVSDEDQDDLSGSDTDYVALILELKYILAGAIAILLICCCLGCIWFCKRQKSQREVLQLQLQELRKSTGANDTAEQETPDGEDMKTPDGDTNPEGEGNDGDTETQTKGNIEQKEDPKAGLRQNAGMQAPYVFVTPQSPSSDGQQAVYPVAVAPSMAQVNNTSMNQHLVNMNQNMMMAMNMMMGVNANANVQDGIKRPDILDTETPGIQPGGDGVDDDLPDLGTDEEDSGDDMYQPQGAHQSPGNDEVDAVKHNNVIVLNTPDGDNMLPPPPSMDDECD